jgi:phage/plasmid-associated DNA primase
MMISRDELKQEITKYHNLGWNIVTTTIIRKTLEDGRIDEVKTPTMKELKPYFDAKNRMSLEELLKHADTHVNPYFALVNGNQPNGKFYISIDIDTKDEQVRRLVLTNIPLSLYQETRKGYHIFLEVEGDPNKIRETLENKAVEGFFNGKRIRIEFRVKDCITFFAGEGYGKLQGEMVSVPLEDINNAIRATLDAFNLCLILQDHYYHGDRNDTIFRLSGILAKKRIPKTVALMIVDALCVFYKDEQRASRLQVTKNSYKAYENGEALNTKLEEVIPKDVAKKIYEYSDFRPNGNDSNNNGNRKKKLDEFIVTPNEEEAYVILDLKKNYAKGSPTIQGLYLLHFYKEGDVDASFLNNYRYVRDPDDKDEGYWIEWTGYCWRKADNGVLKFYLDRFFKHKIAKINELYKEILDAVSVNMEEEEIETNNENNGNGNDGNNENTSPSTIATVESDNNEDDDKYRPIIARLRLLTLGQEPVKAMMRIKEWIEEERETVSELLTYAIRSDTTKNEVLKVITTMDEYVSEGFVISKDKLDPTVVTIDGYSTDIFINTKTHLLYWNNEIEDFIAVQHNDSTKQLYLTKAMDVEFVQGMKCPKFVSFLREICEDNVDLMNYLAIIGGILLVPRREERFFIFTGSGFNGKSTLLKVYLGILGNNGYEADAEDINEFAVGLSPNAYKMIKCISIIVDDPKVQALDALVLKALVSTGSTNVRTLWREPVKVEKKFNVLLAINGRLKVLEHDKAMFRRMVYVRFGYTVPREKVVDNYHLELLKEKNGIFNYFLAGLAEYLRRKKHNKDDLLTIAPDVVKAETDRQLWLYDHLKEFIDRYLITNLDKKANKEGLGMLYAKYLEFCDLRCIPDDMCISKRTFSERLLVDFGVPSVTENKITYKVGIKLRDKPLIDDLESDLYEDERRRFKELKEIKEKEIKEKEKEKEKKEGKGESKNNNNNNNNDDKTTDTNSNNNNNPTAATSTTTTSTSTSTTITTTVKNKPKPKAGRVYVKKRYVVTVRKVSDDKNDKRLQCMHCNAIFTDTYMLMKHIKELAGVDDVSDDVEIEEVGVGSSLLDYTGG